MRAFNTKSNKRKLETSDSPRKRVQRIESGVKADGTSATSQKSIALFFSKKAPTDANSTYTQGTSSGVPIESTGLTAASNPPDATREIIVIDDDDEDPMLQNTQLDTSPDLSVGTEKRDRPDEFSVAADAVQPQTKTLITSNPDAYAFVNPDSLGGFELSETRHHSRDTSVRALITTLPGSPSRVAEIDDTFRHLATPTEVTGTKSQSIEAKYDSRIQSSVRVSFPDLSCDPFLFNPAPSSPPLINPISPSGDYPHECPWWPTNKGAPYSLLVHALQALSSTRSRIAILSILTNLFRILLAHDSKAVLPALYLLSNNLGPSWEGIELGVGGSIISKSIQGITAISSASMKKLYKTHGDPGDVAYYAVMGESSGPRPSVLRPHPPLLINNLYDDLIKIACAKGEGRQKTRQAIVDRLLLSAVGSSWKSKKDKGDLDLNPHLLGEEPRYLVRMLVQNLRVGAVRTTILSALARAIVLTPTRGYDREQQVFLEFTPSPTDLETMRATLRQQQDLMQSEAATPSGTNRVKQKLLQSQDYLDARDRAQAALKKAEEILRRCYAQHPQYEDIVSALLESGMDGLMSPNSPVALTLGIPLMPTLGSPMRSLDDIYERLGPNAVWTAEMKYDGQRAQVHGWREGDSVRVKIFSRHLEAMTDKYPDLVHLIAQVFDSDPFLDSFIVDAEAVAVDRYTGELRSFQELAGRARKDVKLGDVKVAVCLFLFDLMYLNGTSLIQKPFRERRRLLRTHLPPVNPMDALNEELDTPASIHVLARLEFVESVESDQGREIVEEFWEKAVESKCEGLMIKLLDEVEVNVIEGLDEDEEEARSPSRGRRGGKHAARRKTLPSTYEPDKRTSAWLKLKKDYVEGVGDSLDLVPVGAWHGNGRKASWWSPILLAVFDPIENRLVALCKCMSGFTDAFYKSLNDRYPIDSETCSKTSLWNVDTGGYRPSVYFRPSEVWEVRGAENTAFLDSLTISPTSVVAQGMIPQSRERGLSLRFPRFIRIRDDKTIEMASSPAFIVQLWNNQELKGQGKNITTGVEGEDDLIDLVEEEQMEEEYESSSSILNHIMLPSLLPFERLPVTIVVLGCYLAAIISTVIVQERLPHPPRRPRDPGLNLDEAWKDLQSLAQVAHPFNSPINDEIGDYLVKRLEHIQKGKKFISLDIDHATNASWYGSGGYVTYMESRNIVIKFDGSKWNESATLFTAHYDTSSLAPGATDDSIAVVSLLQMARYLADHRPERSIIILFNDGEEDGLHGSRVFLQHPWFKLVSSFVNAEGAGAGGRPNLFRSSSAQITYAFRSAAHPHGSSLFSDAFRLGLVRSTTDYDVYTRAGVPGVDYAFYMGRQKYHTLDDTVSSLRDRSPLWIMMENLHNVVQILANQTDAGISDDTRFVYFDVFGESLFYLRYDMFILLNALLVLLGPVFVVLLGYSLHRSHKIYAGWRGWGRFPLAFGIGVVVAGACIGWYIEYNPMVIDRRPYWVVIDIASFITVGTLLPLHLADRWQPVSTQRAQVLVEMCTFWWIISILNLVLVGRTGITATYFITFYYAATLAATIVMLLDMHRLSRKLPPSVLTSGRHLEHQDESEGARSSVNHENGDNSTERTPLIPRAEDLVSPRRHVQEQLGWIWVIEFLLLAVFPAVLMFQTLFSLLAALGPTVVDGSTPLFVYAFVSLAAMLAILPISPFAHKLPLAFYVTLLIIGIVTATYTTLSPPFTPESPLKAWFWQSTDLDAENSTVTLAGVRPHLQRAIQEVYSIDYDTVKWVQSPRPGLDVAQFPAILPRSVPGRPMTDWVNITLEKTSSLSVTARISGINTRSCRLSFEGGYNVSQAVVRGSNEGGYELPAPRPLKNIGLWSRNWNKTWVVDIDLVAPGSSEVGQNVTVEILQGKASCLWSDRANGKIPALDELYVSFPTWATLTAVSGGLVEGWKSFSV
ncbi:hypothetical protein FRC17_007769 [Serendipita sp. 399]|nr:hypothetical protein FRC17_007769 [Serendipita sp. 399]